ncbi:MAG: hypothetical protein ACFFAT_09425 [Promethearchaeota archaeon]
MGKNGSVRYVAVLGGLLGVVAIIIGLIPSDASWWYVRETFTNASAILNAFGFFTLNNGSIVFAADYLILIAGLSFLIGSLLIIFSASKKKKAIAIFSGFLMIIGLVIFCVGLYAKNNWESVNVLLFWLNTESNVFFGESFTVRWGLGFSFYLAIVGAAIGTIGALVMK